MIYKLFKEIMYNENVGTYETYGIRCGDILEVRDVSLNFDSMSKFVDKLNADKVSIEIVSDVIEDFVAEDY